MPRVSKKNKYFDKSEVITEFYENFSKDVMPILDVYEGKRKKALALFLVISFVILLAMYLVYSYFSWTSKITFLSIMLGLILLVLLYAAIPVGFIENLKNDCMKNLIKCFGSMSWNTKKSTIRDYDLQASELFSVYNGRVDDDSFVGVYKGVEYKVQETYLYNIQGSGSKKLFWPVFDGVVITFDCNKEIKNKTIVTSKFDINVRNTNPIFFAFLAVVLLAFVPALVVAIIDGVLWEFLLYFLFDFKTLVILLGILLAGILIYKFRGLKNSEKLNKIRLEDPVFDRKYNAYSSDEVEGRYLLTTAFMERFKNLHTAFGSRCAKCSFYDNTIMFSISTKKNLFEIGNLFLPVNNCRYVDKFLAEISAVLDLIDYFKLDEKTGL